MTCDNLNNPFSNYGNIVYGENFVGRHEIIRRITKRVLDHSGGCLEIVGSRRIGKSSLAYHVFIAPQSSLIQEKFLTFWISLQRVDNHRDFFRKLVSETLNTLGNDNSQDQELFFMGKELQEKDYPWVVMNEKIFNFFQEVKRASWQIVAVIDEFDRARHIFRDGYGFNELRVLGSEPFYGVNLVTISRRPLQIITEQCATDISNFDNIFKTQYLECFNIGELHELLYKLQIIGLEVNHELVDFVWDNTGGHPYLASALAFELAQSWLNNHEYNLEEVLRNSSSEFQKHYDQSIELLKEDGNLDKMLLQTIFGPVTRETVSKARELERYGLIKRHDNGYYIAFSSHFENYLRTVDRPTDLWSFLNETQRKLRKLVNTVMTEKYHTTDWIPLLEKRELQTRKGKRLDLTNMGDLWEIISRHWNLFEEILGKDKDKGYWHFCLEFLSTVRSPMEYNYPNKFLADDKLKDAKEYCQEILDLLSQSSGGKDSKVSEQSSPQNVIIRAEKYYHNGDYMSKEKSTIDAHSSKFGGGLGGKNQRGGTLYDNSKTSESKQTLAEAAQEIQQLLEQLSQTYPTQTLTQKAVVAEEAVKEIENNPTLKERIRSAIKGMGVQAFMEAIDHPVANILREGIEAFKKPSDD